jgi:hypothetical protein
MQLLKLLITAVLILFSFCAYALTITGAVNSAFGAALFAAGILTTLFVTLKD